MKHKHGNRILGRTAPVRKQLLINLSRSLLERGSIVTTEAKGKELRKFFEPLMTKARRKETLAGYRRMLSVLQSKKHVELLTEAAAKTGKRPGGYLRLTKLPISRNDSAKEVRVDFVD